MFIPQVVAWLKENLAKALVQPKDSQKFSELNPTTTFGVAARKPDAKSVQPPPPPLGMDQGGTAPAPPPPPLDDPPLPPPDANGVRLTEEESRDARFENQTMFR